MLDALRRLLTGIDPLLKAIDRREWDRIHQIMNRRLLTVVGKPCSEGLDPESFTQAELLAQMEKDANAIKLEEPVKPVSVERHGIQFVLVFTHDRYAMKYHQQIAIKLNRVVGVPTYQVAGAELLSLVEQGTGLLFNIGSSDERLLFPATASP